MPPIEPPPSRYLLPPASSGTGRYGFVGAGADFEPGTLLAAYRTGIFPWPSSGVTLWCSPDPRPVIDLRVAPHWSRSLRRAMRTKPFVITVDKAFAKVLEACGDREEGTWISPELSDGYLALHALGWAHSLEVWHRDTGELVGGIYGVAVGGSFSADSMFHRETDASKIAFAGLVERLRGRFQLFDAQVPSGHLASLGCVSIPRTEFLTRLAEARELRVDVAAE